MLTINQLKELNPASLLGFMLTRDLTGVNKLTQSLRKFRRQCALRWTRQYVNYPTAITIYNSLIQPLFDYCDIVWDNCSITSKTRLQKLQNRAARVITQQSYDIRSEEIRNQLRWVTLSDRRSKNKAVMVYKALNGLAPSYLENLFQCYPNSLNYSLRYRETNLLLPKPKTEYMKKTFKFSRAKLWKELPDDLKLAETLSNFKRKLSYYQPVS